jgi:hypothetical protein
MNENNVIERIRKKIPLERKLRVAFQILDYENWKDGEYFGDVEKYVETTLNNVVSHINEHNPDIDINQLLLFVDNKYDTH